MHRFRITVEALSPGAEGERVQFEVENHDDIVAIARRMNGRFELDEASSQAMAIGMKLLGEVVLKNRSRAPFDQVRPALGEFNKAVKAAGKVE
jgi:hypothetical protein